MDDTSTHTTLTDFTSHRARHPVYVAVLLLIIMSLMGALLYAFWFGSVSLHTAPASVAPAEPSISPQQAAYNALEVEPAAPGGSIVLEGAPAFSEADQAIENQPVPDVVVADEAAELVPDEVAVQP